MTTITISLPSQIAKKIDSETKKGGFASRSEFIRNLIRTHLAKKEIFEFEEFEPIPLDQLRDELLKTGKYNNKFINSAVKGLETSSAYNKDRFIK